MESTASILLFELRIVNDWSHLELSNIAAGNGLTGGAPPLGRVSVFSAEVVGFLVKYHRLVTDVLGIPTATVEVRLVESIDSPPAVIASSVGDDRADLTSVTAIARGVDPAMTFTWYLDMNACGMAVFTIPLVLVERDAMLRWVVWWELGEISVNEEWREAANVVLLHFGNSVWIGGWVDRVMLKLTVASPTLAIVLVSLALLLPVVHVSSLVHRASLSFFNCD